jgi:hypothetical protein
MDSYNVFIKYNSLEKTFNTLHNGTKEMCFGANDCHLNSVCSNGANVCVCLFGFQTTSKSPNCGKEVIRILKSFSDKSNLFSFLKEPICNCSGT